MNELLREPEVLWALVLVVVLPLSVIGVGEIEERLRQRDSALTPVISIIRRWAIPLFAIWALGRGLFGLDGANLLIRLLGTALLFAVAAAILAILRIVIARLRDRPQEEGRIPQLLLALPRVGLYIATGWFLLDGVWGVDLSAALTALGVTSLVVSFALQDTLSGLASGLLLLGDAPFQPGDWIRFGDVEGRVMDINWRSSRIRNRNGDLVIVPNAQLAGATLINFDQPSRVHRVVVPVQVAYVNPPTLAKEMLLDAARNTPGVLADPPPEARVVQIDDPLMGYEVHMWTTDYAGAPRMASDFGSLVWYQSHRHDVPLPSPAYDLYVYDGVRTEETSKPDRAEVRRRLRVSPLLDRLDDDDIDRLVAGATPARFARNEVILAAGTVNRDLFVLAQGRARITIEDPDDPESALDVTELSEGDIFGLLSRTEHWNRPPSIVAVTDCEVVIVDAAVAGEMTSRRPALSNALNQLMSTRRRRIERMQEGLARQQEALRLVESDVEDASGA